MNMAWISNDVSLWGRWRRRDSARLFNKFIGNLYASYLQIVYEELSLEAARNFVNSSRSSKE
ncbi:hypothetical protein CK203_040440 [Vitis vinifera]|uniref:Uncharacterized protein n=1 Tax=Vitis vinifera TaxID=29760 RepID=A0A438I839_VITVI|nr:hypothetical protein CK203_040440 [Vitis vinifera]